ncbi:thioesterase domain-containing protein [Kamptonema formosum]|uniref:thioesterase domain-containing protein n=1 Tax=Kamptonema formosum TaxID=331992 RepID=UPI00034CBFD1|nr:amino acid adenylation domain-containing protein [Kamptonema formosum]
MTNYLSDNSLPAGKEKLNLPEETEVLVFPASFAQQRLWFLNQLAPGNPFYNVSTALRLTGFLNLIALEQAFNKIVRRHEILRTTFAMVEGQLSQIIASELTVSLPKIDLQNLPLTQQETTVKQRAIAESQLPFDLEKGPLLRVKLLQLGTAEYVLLLNFHHIIADGWSIAVLIRELTSLYKNFAKNELYSLPELPLQYADFAEWQHQWLQGEVLETQLTYWRQHLKEIDLLNLPIAHPRPPVPTYCGARQFLTLSSLLSEQLNSLSKQENATLFVTLLAAFQTLLYHYTGQENIAIGTPIANRNRTELEGLIGFFVNTLVLRVDLLGNPTFQELLSWTKEVTVAAWAHQDLPFEKLVEALHPDRDLSRNPLFQISFSLQNTPTAALELPELTWSSIDFDAGTAKLDLEFNLWEDLAGIKGQITYSTDLFDSATIARMLNHFQTLLESIVANPKQRLSDLQILTPAERNQILVEFNNLSKIEPNITSICQEEERKSSKIKLCFHQLFEIQVERSPDAIAAVFENQYLTYRELNKKANKIAHYLQQRGVKPEVLVGICIARSLDAIAGLLGILKAGGAYLPLDPNYPQERLNFMLEDAGISILLTTQQHLTRFTAKAQPDCQIPNLTVVCLDRDRDAIARESQQNPISNVTPKNLAYVIYTSGSTGKPKGVLIEHKGLSNLADAQIETFKLQPNHRVLQFASLSFDASIFEIVMALRSGSRLYLATKEALLPGKPLIQFLDDNAISHVTLPPAVLKLLPKAELPALQTLIVAGESCSQYLVTLWAKNRQFFNAYGPTEATVWSSIAELNEHQKVSIGRPILHTQIYILDQNLQPVPIGIPGELHVSGLGVARGYLNRSHLTRQRFIPNPFSDKEGAQIYKTGDLARYLPDGNIEFLCRIDEQVKVRGFRIELGEIEAVLRQHPGVQETAAIACNDSSGNQRLLQQDLPLSSLFINSTIETLANCLNAGKNSLPNSPLVAINSQGSNPPFFCVHPIFGVVFPYYKLAAELGTDQPFYALQPQGIDGECSPLTSIEDMAAFYIAALREVQPQGPYFLGGWSFGGLVAFEMAQQLQKSGDRVALLAVLDTLAPIPSNQISFWDGCKFLFTIALRSVWPFLLDYFRLLAASDNFFDESFASRIVKLNKVIKPIFAVFKANSKATLAYAPETYYNKITLVRSTAQTSTDDRDFTLGWSELTNDKVEVIKVPGNHLTMLRSPHVQVLAQQLKQCFKTF